MTNPSNVVNGSVNDTTKTKVEITKASLYLVNFIFITAIGLLIFRTVQQSSAMKKDVQYFLLYHHLLLCSLLSCSGVVFSTLRALAVKSPKIVFWIIFGMQVATGEGVLITLTLMALNRCCAVCWPLRYMSLVHTVKHQVIICVWMITVFKSMVLPMIEGKHNSTENMFEVVPSCSIILSSVPAKTMGIILILILGTIIIISYILLFIEGKDSGHFNSSNKKAKKTIIVHGLQMSLLLLPSLMIVVIKNDRDNIFFNFAAFVIFSLALCFSPVVYGLRNKELQTKLFNRKRSSLYTSFRISNIQQTQVPEQLNYSELIDTRCSTPGT